MKNDPLHELFLRYIAKLFRDEALIDDGLEYTYIDCYRSVSNNINLDIIRLLTKEQLLELSFPSWQHSPFILGSDPVIILIKGDSLNNKLEKALLKVSKSFDKLIPVITSILSEHQCKRIMDSSIFKELTNGNK